MLISFMSSKYVNNNVSQQRKSEQKFLWESIPSCCDTVAFGAMKKSQFKLFDLAAVNAFKPPIEKFDSFDDFVQWVKNELSRLVQNVCASEKEGKYKQERLKKISEWNDFLRINNDKYPESLHLMILESIAKKLRKSFIQVPLFIEEEVLKELIQELQKNLEKDKLYTFNFEKKYEQKLTSHYLAQEKKSLQNGVGWIFIPSAQKNEEDFEKNLKRLQIFSEESWCTRRPIFSRDYLKKSDFFILLENNKPQIAVRLLDDTIIEIQAQKNFDEFSLEDYLKLQKFLQANKFEYSTGIKYYIDKYEKMVQELEELKVKLQNEIAEKNYDAIFEYFGFKTYRNEQNELILKEVKPISNLYGFHNLGLDVDDMFSDVVAVAGEANFDDLPISRLSNLRKVGGNASFKNTKLKKIENLSRVQGTLSLVRSKIMDLPSLINVGGNLDLTDSQIRCIPNLETVGKNLFATYSTFRETVLAIESLPKLRIINGAANFANSTIKNLESLEFILGKSNFINTEIESLPSLIRIEDSADFSNSRIKSMPKLIKINGDSFFGSSEILNLDSLEQIRGNADFCQTKIKTLPMLFKICGNAIFRNSEIKSLPALRTVGGSLGCEHSPNLENLNNLESVSCYLGLWGTKVSQLPNLKNTSGLIIAGMGK